MPESIFASLKIALLMKIQSFVKCTCCTLSYPLSHHDSVFYVLILLSEALFLPLNQFPPWGLIKLNWTWAEADMKMWRQCGISFHIVKLNIMCLSQMPLTGLTAMIYGFPPGNSAQNHPSTHTPHARAHTNTRRWCSNWLGWGGKSWRTQQQLTHSKHNLCSLESAVTCGGEKL